MFIMRYMKVVHVVKYTDFINEDLHSPAFWQNLSKQAIEIDNDEEFGYTYLKFIDGDVVESTDYFSGMMIDVTADGEVAGIEVPPGGLPGLDDCPHCC